MNRRPLEPGAVLSCGHVLAKQPEGSCGTGYARLMNNHTLCYDCAAKREAEEILKRSRYCAYLSSTFQITTWKGAPLAEVVAMHRMRRGGWAVRAKTKDGRLWYGRCQDAGCLIHLRTLKPHRYDH